MTRTASPSVGATVMVRAMHVHADRARDRLLDAAAELDPAALDQPFAMDAGSLRRTLRHPRAAERLENRAPRPPECFGLPETTPLAGLPALGAGVERLRGEIHRAQAIHMLRALGAAPPALDLIVFLRSPPPPRA
jgi:hypothetical protein